MSPFEVSVCVAAYNEEISIGPMLESVLGQVGVRVAEILVCANACTDRTEQIVESFAARHPRIRLLTQLKRGKPRERGLCLRLRTRLCWSGCSHDPRVRSAGSSGGCMRWIRSDRGVACPSRLLRRCRGISWPTMGGLRRLLGTNRSIREDHA